MKDNFISVPLGDPAGIGPEIVIKAHLNEELTKQCNIVVVGNKLVLDKFIEILNVDIEINIIEKPDDGDYRVGVINLIEVDEVELDDFEIGKVQGNCGKASYKYIEVATKLVLDGKAHAIATTPINKESLKAGNVDFIGHTEILAYLTNSKDPLTMFQTNELRVFFLTRHLSLREACDAVKEERVYQYIKRCTEAIKELGVNGTMGVAGLNPHCGENGLFGFEEVNEIVPAIKRAQEEGIDVVGPIGADSIFHQGIIGKYQTILSLYHDQGHIATKTYDFHKTIAVTLDMPVLRTSVDHGTAYDIAGKNIADPVSIIEAIRLANEYCKSKTIK